MAGPPAHSRATVVPPGRFEAARHWYPRALDAEIHPLVRQFLSLGNERIAERYCHTHPGASPVAVRDALRARPRWFRWGGADLFATTTEAGVRRMVVLETNSCPSGQKSMPLADGRDRQGGYRALVEAALVPLLRARGLPHGALAVLYDKNPMEASGYAAALADATGEDVLLARWPAGDPDPPARFTSEAVLEVRDPAGAWRRVRAAFRYVTQRPWDRIPPVTRTLIFNPVVVCLAGGRNKLLAAKAYDLENNRLRPQGLRIRVPETDWDVRLADVPLRVRRMGGLAVVKNPYSNAGQGIHPITSEAELEAFMALPHRYDRFIVQALIGNSGWSLSAGAGRLFQLATVPNSQGDIYVFDVRFMVCADRRGWRPVALYARRARSPLAAAPEDRTPSWDVLGTNLSVRRPDGGWDTDTDRLVLMDGQDFDVLGLGVDDLIDAYLQTVLAVSAIDHMAQALVTTRGQFRLDLFRSINPDDTLVDEVVR